MQTRSEFYAWFELSTHNPTNLVVIENQRKTVLVRAAHNNFSERRKAFLIRQLAAEGYIPDRYEYFTEEEPIAGVTWVIDRSLMFIGPEATRRTRRFMHRLIGTGCLALVLEMAAILLFKAQ